MKKLDEKRMQQFYDVVKKEKLKSVFQPIFSLQDGRVLGYEALSRCADENVDLSIGQIFEMADKLGYLWDLEKLCRRKALEAAINMPQEKKLFLNVDANVILDKGFETGVTRKYLEKYSRMPETVIFEITERSDVNNTDILKQVIEHYKQQGFQIAIDDVGAGYSGLNRINSLTPQFLKIDYELVHRINESKSQKSLVELIIKHCKRMNFLVIAEGIETEEELRCVIRLGADYGQGFLLGKPEENFADAIGDEKVMSILQSVQKKKVKQKSIGSLSKPGIVIQEKALLFEAYSLFAADNNLEIIAVVDKKNRFMGILKRELFEKNFWYRMEKREKNLWDYLITDMVFTVPESMEKQEALQLAMRREENPYLPIVVLRKERFQGIVEVKDLVRDVFEKEAQMLDVR